MTWDRRRFLELAGAAGIVSLAGCSNSEDTDANPDESEETVVSAPISQQAKLAADDGDSEDFFGGVVTLSDDGSTALIGAFDDEDPNGDRAGSAYVFSQSNGSWQQQTKLTADDGDSDDEFGRAVTLSGDGSTALIGARSDEDPNGFFAGSAYVFM